MPLITVERCGGQRPSFRLTLPGGGREFIPNPDNGWWDKTAASAALDVLQALYGYARASVRFHHLN
jgi:hypothetical protein